MGFSGFICSFSYFASGDTVSANRSWVWSPHYTLEAIRIWYAIYKLKTRLSMMGNSNSHVSMLLKQVSSSASPSQSSIRVTPIKLAKKVKKKKKKRLAHFSYCQPKQITSHCLQRSVCVFIILTLFEFDLGSWKGENENRWSMASVLTQEDLGWLCRDSLLELDKH